MMSFLHLGLQRRGLIGFLCQLEGRNEAADSAASEKEGEK